MAGARLLDGGLVERPEGGRGQGPGRRVDLDGQHHALFDVVGVREEALERVEKLGRFQLGEVAEAAGVDTEHGHTLAGDELDGAQHGAVAPEADGEVEAGRQLLGITGAIAEVELVGDLGRQPDFVAPLTEPGRGLLGYAHGLRAQSVDDEGDRGHLVGVPRRS